MRRSLAEAIERSLDRPAYDAAIDAIARVRGELTWTRMAEATIDVYRSIAHMRRPTMRCDTAPW